MPPLIEKKIPLIVKIIGMSNDEVNFIKWELDTRVLGLGCQGEVKNIIIPLFKNRNSLFHRKFEECVCFCYIKIGDLEGGGE